MWTRPRRQMGPLGQLIDTLRIDFDAIKGDFDAIKGPFDRIKGPRFECMASLFVHVIKVTQCGDPNPNLPTLTLPLLTHFPLDC